MRLLNSLLPLIAGALASVAYSQQLDISGIRMGMSLDQAKAKIGPGFTYAPAKINNPGLEVQYAVKPKEVWVLEAIGGKLAYVSHRVIFPQQSRPNSQDTLNRLVEKYGPPTSQFEANWAFTSSGMPLTGEPHMVQSCAGGWLSNSVTFDAPGPFNRQIAVPGQFPPGCGISISAGVSTHAPPHLTDEFSISMVDIPAQIAEMTRFARAQQQQQTDTLNRGKQNKAPF